MDGMCAWPGSVSVTDLSRYPYPIFEALPTEGRIGLFTLSAAVMALSTITLKWLFGRVNGIGNPIQPESRPGDIKRKEGL
jgi:hypothetical protein